MTEDYELFSVEIYHPLQKNKQRYVHLYSCSRLSQCPLYAEGVCIRKQILGHFCPYGRVTREVGYTPRAKKYNSWLKKWREEYEKYPKIGYPKRRMAIIGDYVWLPYAFMDMTDIEKRGVKFLRYSNFMQSGKPFMRWHDFTLEAVLGIIGFRPYAMMGGEITQYQEESVPKFLYDLRELLPSLFDLANKHTKEDLHARADIVLNHPVKLWVLRKLGWTGKARIYGLPCYVYSKHVEWTGENSFFDPGYADIFEDVTVRAKLPVDTAVVIDSTNRNFLKIMQYAREHGGLA